MANDMTSQKIKEEKKSGSNCGIVHIRKAAVRLEEMHPQAFPQT
jgi:hypothetical protein